MNEQPSAAPSRAPQIAGAASIALLIAAAVAGVEPETTSFEGEQLRAYLDPAHVPTICRGHTGPDVHLGMVSNHAQCRAWYRADMTRAMTAAIAATPTLPRNRSALEASGDFTLNAGPGWWRKSPMAARFSRLEWAAGCNAFPGYVVLYRAPKPVPGGSCRRNSKGVLYCQAPGLVKRRLRERAICLGPA